MSTVTYIVITPVRDEAQFLQKTIDSVTSQSLRPFKWVMVDDGSTDDTGQIIDAAAKQHSWISVMHRGNRGFRQSGGGVVEAFNAGYALVHNESWDFLVKLDGDLSFSPNYFESSFAEFRADPKLGIGGGLICSSTDGHLLEESSGDPAFHVRGATKMYRQKCWQDIGGLLQVPGWDTLDEVKANMRGWNTRTFKHLKLLHFRHAGGADGTWKNWVKNGRANYITGYHPVFMSLKCLKRAFSERSVTIPAGLWWGYLTGYLQRIPQADPDITCYVRKEQVKRLLMRPSLWG